MDTERARRLALASDCQLDIAVTREGWAARYLPPEIGLEPVVSQAPTLERALDMAWEAVRVGRESEPAFSEPADLPPSTAQEPNPEAGAENVTDDAESDDPRRINHHGPSSAYPSSD